MDRKPPLKTLEQQAAAGDGASACVLGDYYRTGDGVAQDWAAAFAWYRRGAELGDCRRSLIERQVHYRNQMAFIYGCTHDNMTL